MLLATLITYLVMLAAVRYLPALNKPVHLPIAAMVPVAANAELILRLKEQRILDQQQEIIIKQQEQIIRQQAELLARQQQDLPGGVPPSDPPAYKS